MEKFSLKRLQQLEESIGFLSNLTSLDFVESPFIVVDEYDREDRVATELVKQLTIHNSARNQALARLMR